MSNPSARHVARGESTDGDTFQDAHYGLSSTVEGSAAGWLFAMLAVSDCPYAPSSRWL